MSNIIARLILKIAMASLSQQQRDWAWAMRMELEVIAEEEERKALPFALGCLMTAWREMPAHVEGRLTLACYAIALGLILPVSAFLLAGVLNGYPYLDPSWSRAFGVADIHTRALPLLHDGNRSAAGVLTLTLLLCGALHFKIAWFAVEKHWESAAALQRLSLAANVTLLSFTSIIIFDVAGSLVPAVALTIDLIAMAFLNHVRIYFYDPELRGESL
jgi:hypothetical protein